MTITEIPEEIMRKAEKCVMQFRVHNDHLWLELVARALMARDQRAADIARKQGLGVLGWGVGGDYGNGYEVACQEVAEEILTYSEGSDA